MRLRLSVLLLATVLGWPGRASASVMLSHMRAESAVAIDPRDSRVIAVAANPTYRFNALHQEPIGVFITRDGGRSWESHDAPLAPPYVVGSDPSIAFAPDGSLFVAYEAVAGGFCGSTNRTAVLVTRSHDVGRSFAPPVVVDSDPANDKPFMAAGPGGVYVSWIRFQSAESSQIAFSRSLDGGAHFTAPTLLSSGPGIHVAPMPAAGRAGQVYVAWLTGLALPGATSPRQHMETRTSLDHGAHFGPLGHTSDFLGLPGIEQPGSLRLFNGPSVATGRPHHLYLSWAEKDTAGAEIVLSRSSDDGRHWSAPFVLSDSVRGDRFEPQIVATEDGRLVAAFYDRRRNGVDLDLQLATARETHAGIQRGPNVRLTATPAPLASIPFIPPGSPCLAQGRFFGDYLGLAAGPDGRIAVAWTSSEAARSGETQIRFLLHS